MGAHPLLMKMAATDKLAFSKIGCSDFNSMLGAPCDNGNLKPQSTQTPQNQPKQKELSQLTVGVTIASDQKHVGNIWVHYLCFSPFFGCFLSRLPRPQKPPNRPPNRTTPLKNGGGGMAKINMAYHT